MIDGQRDPAPERSENNLARHHEAQRDRCDWGGLGLSRLLLHHQAEPDIAVIRRSTMIPIANLWEGRIDTV